MPAPIRGNAFEALLGENLMVFHREALYQVDLGQPHEDLGDCHLSLRLVLDESPRKKPVVTWSGFELLECSRCGRRVVSTTAQRLRFGTCPVFCPSCAEGRQ